jgi:quinol-cytochrome oxidoreductase complex cytochrome b subunit
MSFWTVLVVWGILLAAGLGGQAIINLRAEDPRARSTQLVSVLVVLALMTAAFAIAGFWGAALILVLAIGAEAVRLVRRRGRAR